MSITVCIFLIFIVLLSIVFASRFNTVGSQNQDQYIRLKSQYDLKPGKVVNLQIEVPNEYISLNGYLTPRLKSISSPILDGIYGTGDIIFIDMVYSAEIGVYQSPSLTLNTGCHDPSCTTIEKQMFTCAADRGKFAMRLENEFLMNIDVNTTKEELKKLMEHTFTGINQVTITYSVPENRTYNHGDRVCSSIGNTVSISFNDVSFPQYNGNVPLLQVDATNTYPDIRSGLNIGENDTFLQGVPPHSRSYTPKLSIVKELVQGFQISDAIASYYSGNLSSIIRFKYVVKNGDLTQRLEVKQLDFMSGYLYGLKSNAKVSTTVPNFRSGTRYMSPVASALGFNQHIIVNSAQPQIISVTSPNINAVYTQGDVILIHIIYDLPVKVFGEENFLLQLSTGSFDRQIPFIQLINKDTLEFKYTVQEGDTSSDLDYAYSTSFALNSGYIFRDTSTNETVANITLPDPGRTGSLSFNKMLVINTLSPQIVSIKAVSRKGIYTGGDLIDFEVLYGDAIHVKGSPRLLIQNTPTPLNANILTAPFNPANTFRRARPNLDVQISFIVTFNWNLSPGDEILVYLPGFYVKNDPINEILNTNRTLNLKVSYNDLEMFSEFSGKWLFTDETLVVTTHKALPSYTDIMIIIDGSSGLFGPANGLYAHKFTASLSVKSPNMVDPDFSSDYKFDFITSIGFSYSSLVIKPLIPGAPITYLAFAFNVSEPLQVGDTIVLHLDGIEQVNCHSFTNLHFSDFYLSWQNDTYEFKIVAMNSSTELSHVINILTNDLLFNVPHSGLYASSGIAISADMQYNGQVGKSSLSDFKSICSVQSQPGQNKFPSVQYLTKIPGAQSSAIFEWQNSLEKMLIGDSVVFGLPDFDHNLGAMTRSILPSHVQGLNAFLFEVYISAGKVTFTAIDMIPPLTYFSILIDRSAGLVVPSNGIRSMVDSFTFFIQSTSCNMASEVLVLFSLGADVTLVNNPEVKLTTNSNVLKLGEPVKIYASFEISKSLKSGDMFTITVPGFHQDFLAHPNGIILASNANLAVKMDYLLQMLNFTLISTFSVTTVSTLHLTIDYTQGFYLPQSSVSSDAFRLNVISNSVVTLENIVMKTTCLGFCFSQAVYSAQFLNETLSVEAQLIFSNDLENFQPIFFQMNGFKLSRHLNFSCSLQISDSEIIEQMHLIKWISQPINSGVNKLEIILPRNISALTKFTFIFHGLELFQNNIDLYDNFAVFTNDKVIGNSSAVMNYPTQVVRKFYFIQSRLLFSSTTYSSATKYTNMTMIFQLPETLILDEGNFIEVVLPGFVLNTELNDDFLVENLKSHSNSYNDIIDLENSIISLNEETVVIRLFLKYKLFGNEILTIHLSSVILPSRGISSDTNINGISYKIGLSPHNLITASQYFTNIQDVIAITDLSVDLSLSSRRNYSLNNISISFYSSSLIHIGDYLEIQLPGLGINDVSNSEEVTIELLSASFSCVARWFKNNSTIILEPKSASSFIGMQYIVVNTFHPYRFHIQSTGIPSYSDATINFYLQHLDETAFGKFQLPCIALCGATIIPEVRKAGYSTNFNISLNFSGIEFLTSDQITLNLDGFSVKNYKTMNISGIDLINSNNIALKLSMNSNAPILSIDFIGIHKPLVISELFFVIPESFGLIAPLLGIRSGYLFDVSIWTFSSIQNKLVLQYSNNIGTAAVIGKVKESSIVLSSKVPGSVTEVSFSFSFFDKLLVGDMIRIYLPSFYVPTFELVNNEFSGSVQIKGMNGDDSKLLNVDGTEYYLDRTSQLRVVLLHDITPSKKLTFSIGNISQVTIPKIGIYQRNLVPWIAIESSSSPIANAPFLNYTRIGSFSPATLKLNRPSQVKLILEAFFTINCPLFTNDIIFIHIFNVIRYNVANAVSPNIVAYSKPVGALNFTASWDAQSSEIKLLIVDGTYMMSGAVTIELALEGFSLSDQVSYSNDKRHTVRLQSNICPFDSTSFDETTPLFLSTANINFDTTTSISQSTTVGLSLIPEIDLHPFDVLELKFPFFSLAMNDTSKLINISSNGAFYDSAIANYSSILNQVTVYAIVHSVINANTPMSYSAVKPILHFPNKGVSIEDIIQLKVLRSLEKNITDFLNLSYLANSTVLFQGPVQNIQPVMYFMKKEIKIGNPRPGAYISFAIEWILSQSIPADSNIVVELPGFVCSQTKLLLEGSASEFFVATWNQASSKIDFTSIIMVPKFQLMKAEIILSNQFISPVQGVPQSSTSYYISLLLNSIERLKEKIIGISVVPNVKASILSFRSSEFSDSFNVGGNANIIQLNPGHELTAQDHGAQIIISGEFYTIQTVADNMIYLLEPYNGTRVFMGYPKVPIFTPPYRFADYFAGSGSTSLIFQYKVRRGDDSTGLMLFKPTSAYNTNNAHETLDLNQGYLFRNSNSPSLVTDISIPAYNLDSQRSVNSDVPYIKKFFVSSPTGVYSVGQQIDFQLQYSDRVLVGSVSDSIPELLLKIMPSGKISAHYKSGSGTNTLVFVYDVTASDLNNNINHKIISAQDPIYQPLRVITDNTFNYIRRYSDEALIDAKAVLDLNNNTLLQVEIPLNISLVGDAIKVESIWTPMHIMGSTFSVGDNIILNVLFTDSVFVSNPAGSSIPYILLEVGSGTPGIASYHSKLNDSTLSFVYQVKKEDKLLDGLYLHCTCLDYFQRTFIHLGNSQILSVKTSNRVSVLLAKSSSIMDLQVSYGSSSSTFIIDQEIPHIMWVNSNLSADSSFIYSPGTIASINVKFSKPVTVRGILRIWLKAQFSPCPARYYSGNNSDILTFLYLFTEVSGISTLDYVDINSFDTSMGIVYRYSDNPSMIVNTELPKPGVPESLGLRSPSLIDTALVSIAKIDVVQTIEKPFFAVGSLSFNLYPGSNISYQYLPQKMRKALLPISNLFENYSIDGVIHLWRTYSSQELSFTDNFWISEHRDIAALDENTHQYYSRIQLSVLSMNQISFLPQLSSIMSLQAPYFNSYWWTNVEIRNKIEFSVEFNLPVVVDRAFIQLNTETTSSILNRAFSNKFVHQYFLTVQSSSPFDYNHGQLVGSTRESYRLKYRGYLTRCISVTADAKSVYSIQLALEEISALLILDPNVVLMYTKNIESNCIISYYRIDFVNLPEHELQVVTGAELGDSCPLPALDDQVKLNKENSSVTFSYDINGDNAIVFKAHSNIPPGEYTVSIDSSNLIGISASGIDPHSFQLKRYNQDEQFISKSNIHNATFVPQVYRSALAFSSSIPNTPTAININLCFDIALNIGVKLILNLYDFGSVWENKILSTSLLSNSGNVKFIWDYHSSTMQVVLLKDNVNCLSEIIDVSFGFVLPSRSIYQNSFYFTFEIKSNFDRDNIGAVVLPATHFQYVSPVGIGSFAITFSDPRPYYPTSLFLAFSIEVDTVVDNTALELYNSTTSLEIYLPGFHTKNGYSGKLAVSSDYSVSFIAYWSNFTSTLSLLPMGSISKGTYQINILSREADRFKLYFPSEGLYENNPPMISFKSDQWSSMHTVVHDIPYVYGHEDSFINVTFTEDFSSYNVKAIVFGVNFSRPIDGPAYLNITMPFLNSSIAKVVLEDSGSVDAIVWYESEKKFCISRKVGWPAGYVVVQIFGLKGFYVNELGVPLKRDKSGITFSVIGLNGFLNMAAVRHVTRVPVVQYSSIAYSSMSKDIFTSDKQTITINLKLNLPALPLDMFYFDLPGIQFLNESNSVISDPCVSINDNLWSNYLSEPHTVVIYLLNSSVCLQRKMEYTWVITEKVGSNMDLRSVVQYNSGCYTMFWLNTYRNIENLKVVDYPTLGITASSLEFSNPYAGQVTDIIIRLLTASALMRNDIIQMQIPQLIFNDTNSLVLDQYGRKWLFQVDTNISFVVPQNLNATALYFRIKNCVLSSSGIEDGTKEITIAIKRGSHAFISPQVISQLITPVGFIALFELYPIRSLYYSDTKSSMNRVSNLGFMIILNTLSVLNAGDVIYIELANYVFHYDSDLAIDGKDSYAVKLRTVKNRNALEIKMLQSIDNTLLQLSVLPNKVIEASDQVCHVNDNDCDTLVSIDSKSNPVYRQMFKPLEIFSLPDSSFKFFQQHNASIHHNVSVEIFIKFRNTFKASSILSIHIPDDMFPDQNNDLHFSLLPSSQALWNLTMGGTTGKTFNQTIHLMAKSDILPGNSTQRIFIESNILYSLSKIIYNEDPRIYYQIAPRVKSINNLQYVSEIGNFAIVKPYGLSNSTLVLSNPNHGEKTSLMIDLQADINSKFHPGDNITIYLKNFVLYSGTHVKVNTTNNIATIWNAGASKLNVHVHEYLSSIKLITYWFVVPSVGINSFSSIPQLSLNTMTGSKFIDTAFNVYTKLAAHLKVQILFKQLLVAQESVISIHLIGKLYLNKFDQISIFLPQFWCSRRNLQVNSTSNGFLGSWDVSRETLVLQSMGMVDSTAVLTIDIIGLRLPYDGVSTTLVDLVRLTSNSTRGGSIEVSNIDMQLVGSIIHSSLLFSPGRLDVANDLHFSFEFNVPININGSINLHLPGFRINSQPHQVLFSNISCISNNGIITKGQLFHATWDSSLESLSLKGIRKLNYFERCVVILKNIIHLPLSGVSPSDALNTHQNSLSLYQIGLGSIDPTPIENVQYVGFISASISYDAFLDADAPVSFMLEFYPSAQIEIGDTITFNMPLLMTSEETPNIINLSVLGDLAEKNFAASFSAKFYRATKTIILTAIAVESSRYISISVEKLNNFRFISDASSYTNNGHYISGHFFHLGFVAQKRIKHSPQDFYGIKSKLLTLNNCSSTHTSYEYDRYRGCSIQLDFTVYSDIKIGESLVLSHPNLYRPLTSYKELLNNQSVLEYTSIFRPSLQHNLELNISGNFAELVTPVWRHADNVQNIHEASQEIYLIDSQSSAFALADLSYYELNTSLPSNIFPDNIQIANHIPRIINVYIQHKHSTGSYLSCEDVVEIIVNFDVPISVHSPEKLSLLLNTGETAGYERGNQSTSLLFSYTVISPANIYDLELFGPGALEYYLPGTTTSVYSADNLAIPANLTIPPPYGQLLLEDNQFKQLSVSCKTTAFITEVSAYSKKFSIYATNDIVDIQVIFNRPVTVIGDPYLLLESSSTSPGYNLKPIQYFKAEFVNVSYIQWLDTPLFGLFQVSYEGQNTNCMEVSNLFDIQESISELIGLKHSLPLNVFRYIIENGYRYKLVFGGVAPRMISSLISTNCGELEVPVSISIDEGLYNKIIFRYIIQSGDHAKFLTYRNDSSLVLPTTDLYSTIIYLTGRSVSTLVNSSLPDPLAINSLFVSSKIQFRTEAPYAVCVYSNYTGPSILQSGDVVYIMVNYSAPVIVKEPQKVMLELNISNTLPSLKGHVILEKLSLYFVYENVLYFKYIAKMGDYAKYLTTSNVNMLYGTKDSVLLKSIDSITPAVLRLPAGNALTGLEQSKVFIQANNMPVVLGVSTNHSNGSFNRGEDIFITISFSAIVNVFELITDHKVYPKASPYMMLTSPEDAFMLYVLGSGTSEIIFKYTVDEVKEISANISFHINLLQGYFQDQFKRNFTQLVPQLHHLFFEIENLTVSSEPAFVIKVDLSNPNGTYYPGDTLDLFVVFNKPVVLLGGYSLPALELFLPTQSGSDLLAIYSWGNGTSEIHFEYVIPPPNFNYQQQAFFVLDYSNADGLYKYLYHTKITDISTHPTTEANVYLPTKDQSYLTHHRFIFVDFSICKVIQVFSTNEDGIYTAGDVVSISVQFSSPVMVFYPPVLKLATGNVNRSAIYTSGNGTKILTFNYEIKIGDTSTLLDYIDTRSAPYNIDIPDQSFALNTIVLSSINTIMDNETNIFVEASIFGGVYMLSNCTDASKRVGVYTALPIPGQIGSLSKSSMIVIDTTAPFIEIVTTTIASGTYGHGVSIPIYMLFNAAVTITGCPYIVFQINDLDKSASYVSGNNSELVQFQYIVQSDDVVHNFDYFDRFSLRLGPCPQSPITSVNNILRYSAKPEIYANLTMPWVRYVESVISPVSIAGSGKDLNIIAPSKSGPRLIWSLLTNIRNYSLGDVIDISIGFGSSVIYSSEAAAIASYLLMDNAKRKVYYAYQENDTTITFPFVVQHLETIASLSYPDPFSLITPTSPCAIITSSSPSDRNECVPQNLPIPFSTSPESSIDALSPIRFNILQSQILVQSVSFILPTIDDINSTTYFTGSIINIVVQFSEAVLVQGNPILLLQLENDFESRIFYSYFNAILSSSTKLVFQAFIDSSSYYGKLSCSYHSAIHLNGGNILREANFLPIMSASIALNNVCCKNSYSCDVFVLVESKVPVVINVYSPQNGVYSKDEKIDIYVQFNVPIKVVGSLAIKLELPGVPSPVASYLGISKDNEGHQLLHFEYIIKQSDYTSSLDYEDINSLVVTTTGPYDGIFLLSSNISALLSLPMKGGIGSLGRESSIVINTNRPNLLDSFASPNKATSGDDLYITLRYSEPMRVVMSDGTLFSSEYNLDAFVALSLDFVPTIITPTNLIQKRIFEFFNANGTDIIFRYQVQASDPTGTVYFSSFTPITSSNVSIESALTSAKGPSEFPANIASLLLATIDNNIPYVLQVFSSEKSSVYPFGVGDVLDIFVEMSLYVVVKQVPFLNLVLDNGKKAVAQFSSDNPSPVKVLKFQYKVLEGDAAYPLEYAGNYALVGLLLRYSTYKPTIIANLYLPDPFSLGSLTYCCNLVVDSSPPHVVSLIPLKRPGVYGENEIIYIMARFNKPVVVTGSPELFLSTKVDENNEVIQVGIANYVETIDEYDIPIDIRNTDIFFRYVVKAEDNVISLHHSDVNAINLNHSTLIQQLTSNPTLSADILLLRPNDFTVRNGILERQWKFRFPSTVEILLRDFYHTKADSITATVQHSGNTAVLFKNCCSKKTFGYSYQKTRSGTNSTLQSLDTGIGEDFMFSDLVSSNIALYGIVSQSSTRVSARLSIDGNTDPLIGDGSVSETNEEENAWWQISLPTNSTIQAITIWPRKPQSWINPIIQMTIKSFDRYSDGKYRLKIRNIDKADSFAEALTEFIPMNATALQIKIILEGTEGLGNVDVTREMLPLCPRTGQGCGAGGYQSGFGFRYDLSFLSIQTPSPMVTIEQITFPGEDVITAPALRVPPNVRTSEFYHLIEITRTGYYIQVPEQLTYGKGVQQSTTANTNNLYTNQWLTPFWVFIFDIEGDSIPGDLNTSINSSIWYQRYEHIENSLNIVLTSPAKATFVKIQREGFGSLSLAELQIFEERIDTLAYYNHGSPVRPSTLSSPYQPEQAFKNTFNQLQFDGTWIVQISQDISMNTSPQGWSGASGTISEAVLIITDLAGIVHSYYQDLRAEILSLPKYGSLFYTIPATPSPYGDWREAFEIGLEGQLTAKDGAERSLGYCYGPDTTDKTSTIYLNQSYTSCQDNFGVGPLLNSRVLGDTATSKYLRNERLIVYRPYTDYLGPDFFTYAIYDGLNIQSHEYLGGVQSSNNEVLAHVRRCRQFQSRSQYALTATQSSSFSSDGRHVLCTCAQTEAAMVGNRTTCDTAILAVCDSNQQLYKNDPVDGHRQFLALCLTCTDPQRGLNSSDCRTQIIRAVSLLTSRNLCVPSAGPGMIIEQPVMDCSMETFTEPGKESNNYLTIKPPVLFGSFSRLKNCFGAYGWYHTPSLN